MNTPSTITGVAQVIERINRLEPDAAARLVTTVRQLAIMLQGYVKASKLSGQVLRNRTGTLRRSINQRVTVDTHSVVGSVGTNVIYGRFWEYGFTGDESVREHIRKQTMVFGNPISPREVIVRAHSRHVNQPARSFLRSALADKAGTIREQLAKAVHDSVQGK